jgi:hypothetical protein
VEFAGDFAALDAAPCASVLPAVLTAAPPVVHRPGHPTPLQEALSTPPVRVGVALARPTLEALPVRIPEALAGLILEALAGLILVALAARILVALAGRALAHTRAGGAF